MGKLERFFAIVSGFCLTIVFLVAFAQVIQRYFFSMSIPWATDVIRICFIYSVVSGMCVGVIRKTHLNIDVFVQLTPLWMRPIFSVISNVVLAIFIGVVLRYSIPFIQANADQVTPYLEFPMSYVYAVFPVTTIVMLLAIINDTYKLLSGRSNMVTKEPGEGEV